MIFNSVSYLIFIFIVVSLYWLFSKKYKTKLILISSLIFYGSWRPEFLLILLFTAMIDFIIAKSIYQAENQNKRFYLLILSVGLNIGLLIYFKYSFFILDNAVVVLNLFGIKINEPVFNIILPLGISFYTFEAISYVVDVYRRLILPEKSALNYLCFITFFPKLIAGPIIRAAELLPQLSAVSPFRLSSFNSGLKRILYGLFLKVVIADNISPLVDSGFEQSLDSLSALDVWTLAFLFGFQIYFDFSAYSSIAIGSARLLGINLPENFNFPYLSSSPREFWHRWHISLSSWIRDYLYLPLQGIKVRDRSEGGISINLKAGHLWSLSSIFALFMTWSIMGLWHGASWTFLLWGVYHCAFILLYRIFANFGPALSNGLKVYGGWVFTLPIVMLGWIPFRADSIHATISMWQKLLIPRNYLWLGMRENTYLITALLLIFILITYWFHKMSKDLGDKWPKLNFIAVAIVIAVVVYLDFIFLRPINQFIYFQF